MNAKKSSVRAMQTVLVAGIVVASGSALGQQSADIVIGAERATSLMRNKPTEVISITRHVSYADLDLATKKGDSELEKRINDAATAVCKRLDSLQSPKGAQDMYCVKKAVDGAMTQAHAAISAASAAAAK
jgi:UrcA family protein